MSDAGREDFELPFDSDVEVDDIEATGEPDAQLSSAVRPPHLRPLYLLVVGLGGSAGTLARFLLQQRVEPWQGVPLVTIAINVSGAFLLGLLLETLVRRGEDVGRRRLLRLLLGTGVLGGFTTYSALAADTVTLLHESQVLWGILYAVGTVLLGAVGAVIGIAVGVRANRRARATGSAPGLGASSDQAPGRSPGASS